MTDYTDLIARLRKCQRYITVLDAAMMNTAADVIEAQAKRIAELELEQEWLVKRLEEKNTRIAELEAALEPLVDCEEYFDEDFDFSDELEVVVLLGYLRRAREVLTRK